MKETLYQVAGFQVYALILSITAIGVPGAISRLVADKNSKGDYKGAYKIFKISLLIFSIIGIVGSYFLVILAGTIARNYLKIPEAELSIIALAPSIFLVSIISVFKGYFGGIERLKETAKAHCLDQITKTFSTFMFIEASVLIANGTNTKIMAACANLATTVANIIELVCLYHSFRKIRPEIIEQSKHSTSTIKIRTSEVIREIIAVAVPISLTALIGTLAKNIDSATIVNKLKEIIGYEQAKKEYGILSGKVETLINFPLSFNVAITTALLPVVAASRSNLKRKESVINKSVLFGSIITVPAIAIFIGFADEILKLLFPNASNGANILRMSSISILLIVINQTLNNILYGIGRSRVPIIAVTVGVIIKAILNSILVPRVELPIGGTVGAAFATVMYNAVTVMISYLAIKKYTNIKIKLWEIGKPIISSVLMIGVAKTILSLNIVETKLNLIISIGIGAICYIIMLFITRAIQPKDVSFIKLEKGRKTSKIKHFKA